MGVVHELIKGVDEKTRGAVVCNADKGKSSYLRHPLRRLFLFEILHDVKKELESVTGNVASVKEGNPEPVQAELREMPLRPRRQAARAGGERRRLLTNAWSRWLNLLELKTKLRREHIMIQCGIVQICLL